MVLLSNGTKHSPIHIHLIVKLTVLFACTIVQSQNIHQKLKMLVFCMKQNGKTKFRIPVVLISLVCKGELVWALAQKYWTHICCLFYFSFLLTVTNLTKHIPCSSCTFLTLKSNNSQRAFFFIVSYWTQNVKLETGLVANNSHCHLQWSACDTQHGNAASTQ